MIGAVDILTPCFKVATVAASSGLLGNEEADVMLEVIRGLKASCTENAAIVERAISVMGDTGKSNGGREHDVRTRTCIGNNIHPF